MTCYPNFSALLFRALAARACLVRTFSGGLNFGFTHIELVICISIIGILAAIAVPNFHSYQLRAYKVDIFTTALPAKQKIENFYAHRGRFPQNNREAGLLPADKIKTNYVSSLAVENGAIHVTFGARAPEGLRGHVLTIQPAVLQANSTAPIVWVHADGNVPQGRKLVGENRTTIKET